MKKALLHATIFLLCLSIISGIKGKWTIQDITTDAAQELSDLINEEQADDDQPNTDLILSQTTTVQ